MHTLRLLCLSATLIFLICISVLAQTTSFSYQGRLTDMGSPANGNYVLQFRLFDALSSGMQVGATIADVSVTATNGSFTTSLDFGAAVFDGSNRFLEISVKRLPADPYTTLTPRQQILSTPYSIKSKTADNSTQLGGLDSTRYVQQDVTGNVSVSGTLTVTGAASYNTVNAQTQYNLGGSRILGNSGTKNLFIGNETGSINSGGFNTFVGQLAAGYRLHRIRLLADEAEPIKRQLYQCRNGQGVH